MRAIVLGFFTFTAVGPTPASAETMDLKKAIELIGVAHPPRVADTGRVEADRSFWKVDKDSDGTEVLTSKTGDERIAIMKSKSGIVESMARFTLAAKKSPNATAKPENSLGMFFDTKKQLQALTTCEDEALKDSVGRICVTATARLCGDLRSGGLGTDTAILDELDGFEMRALASILTLRGSDHQLDNVIRSGNRLGLKTALQTTRGQLIALAKQVSSEVTSIPPQQTQPDHQNRSNRAHQPNRVDHPQPADQQSSQNIARSVLEKSLPRLKKNCLDAHFLPAELTY